MLKTKYLRLFLSIVLSVLLCFQMVSCDPESNNTDASQTSETTDTFATTDTTETTNINEDNYFFATGYVIKTETAYFFIADDNLGITSLGSPLRMKNDWSGIDLDFLKSGDHIRIRLQIIEESYPPQAPIYGIELLSEGMEISSDVIEELQGLGYTIIP